LAFAVGQGGERRQSFMNSRHHPPQRRGMRRSLAPGKSRCVHTDSLVRFMPASRFADLESGALRLDGN